MQESMYGLLLSVESTVDELVLKLDLTGDTVNLGLLQPVLKVVLTACPQAQSAHEELTTRMGFALQVVPARGAESTHLELYFDLHDPDVTDPDLALTCADWRLKRSEYTVADLAAKLKWQDRMYQRRSQQDADTLRHQSDMLASLRRELKAELDRAYRKIAFFAGQDKAKQFQIEQQCYQRMLKVLEYQTGRK